MGCLNEEIKVAIWDKWFKKEKGAKKKPALLQQQKQKKQKLVKIDSTQDINKIMELIKSSFLIGKTDERYQEIIDNLAWLRNNVAQQKTLEKVSDECAKENTLKDFGDKVFLVVANEFKRVQKEAFGNTTNKKPSEELDIPKEAERITKNVNQEVERTIIRDSQNRILEALKEHGELVFGNDARTKGLTKYTGLERTWIYKVVYLGWDNSGSIKKPQKGTLLAKGLVKVDTEQRPFRVRVKG